MASVLVSAESSRSTDLRADEHADRQYDIYATEFLEDDPRASGYRSVVWFRRERSLIIAALREHCAPNEDLLDLACGAGLVTRPLMREGWKVQGLDFNEGACRNARRAGLSIVRGDAFALPFAAASFGGVVSVEMLQQYGSTDVERLLRESRRVVRDNGHVILVWRNGRSFVHRMATSAMRFLDRRRGIADLGLHDHSAQDMRNAAVRTGFDIVSMNAIFPGIGMSFSADRRVRTAVIGSSYLAVLRAVQSS